MRSGFAPPLVGSPIGSAVVNGVARDAVSVSTTREIGGGGVPGAKATAAASGSVEWAQIASASDSPGYSPWNRTGNWPPVPGSGVQVDAGVAEGSSFRMLTGMVDKSSAGSDGVVTSTVIDPVDRLHRVVTIPAMLSTMPPASLGGEHRRVGLSSDYIADAILRRCAYFTTPYMTNSMNGVSVAGQGSMWPERGSVVTASAYGNAGLPADFLGSEWGWGIDDANATYTPDGNLTGSAQFTIACMIANRHESLASVTVTEAGLLWVLRVHSDRSITVTFDGTQVVGLAANAATRRVEARVTGAVVSLTTDDGRTASGAHGASPTVVNSVVSAVRIQVQDGGNIGGVMVANMPAGHYLNYPLSARMNGGTALNPDLIASPRIEVRDALEVLSEIADATCRAYWWDEDGVFQWIPGDYLLSRPSVADLTSRDSLLDFGWSESLADTYQRVSVSHEIASVSRARSPKVTVWTGSGESYESGEAGEEVLSPPTDEEWYQVHTNPVAANGSSLAQVNRGYWTVWGAVRTDGSTTIWGTDLLSSVMTSIGPNAWKFTHTVGTLPAGQSLQLAFPSEDSTSAVWMRWRNEKLPIVRAYAKAEWSDSSVNAGSGPANAGEYQHDAGRWAQGFSGETPGRIADFLAAWLCVPRVMAEGVSVVHDPRIQVGDTVTVRDEHAHGVELRALVTRVDQSTSAGTQDMNLDLFVISGAPAWRTLGMHDAAAGSLELSAHNTQESGEDLGEHNVDPWHYT